MGASCASCKTAQSSDIESHRRGNINVNVNQPLMSQDLSGSVDAYDHDRGSDEERRSRADDGTYDDHDDDESSPEFLIKQWTNAVDSQNNDKIKHLFSNHYKHLNFLAIQWPNGDSTLHKACATNNVKLVKFLLILKIDVNEINEENGNTCLHYAVLNGHEKIVKLLIKVKTIDLKILNKDGYTPLDISISQSKKSASKTGNVQLQIEKLLLKAIDHDSKKMDQTGLTPYHHQQTLGVHDHSHELDNDSNIDTSDNSGINNIGSIVVNYSGDESEGARRSSSSLTTPMSGFASVSNETTPSPESVGIDRSDDVKTDGRTTFSRSIVVENTTAAVVTECTVPVQTEKNIKKDGSGNKVVVDKSGWIEKKRTKFPHTFEKKYCIICQGYLLWNHKEIDITDKELGVYIHYGLCLYVWVWVYVILVTQTTLILCKQR